MIIILYNLLYLHTQLNDKDMKANVQLEIDKDDLSYELKELISELATPEIKKMIKEIALPLVKKEVDKILEPLVVSTLSSEQLLFGSLDYYSGYDKSLSTLDNRVKAFMLGFLNKTVYKYNDSSRKPSEKYMTSSSDSDDTLITCVVKDAIKEFISNEFKPIVGEMLKSYISDIEKMKEIYTNEAKKLVLETIK